MNKNKKDSDFFLNYMKKQQEKETQHSKIQKDDSSNKPSFPGRIVNLLNFIMEIVNRILYSLLENRKTMSILALVLAIIFYVSIRGGDKITIDRKSDVEIKVLNLSDEYVVEGIPSTCYFYLEGSPVSVYMGKYKDYYAYCDLSNYQEGNYTDVPLKIFGIPGNTSTTIVPDRINISVYKKVSVNFPLSYAFINEDKLDTDQVVQKPQLPISSVKVSGKQADIDKIAKVVVEIDLTGINNNTIVEGILKAYDYYNTPIEHLIFEEEHISVPLEFADAKKNITIKPVFIGLSDQQSVSSISYNIDGLYYYGTENNLKDYSELKVEINLKDMDENGWIRNIELPVPDDIAVSDNTIDAKVMIDAKSIKTFSNIPLEIKGIEENIKYITSIQQCTVRLTGALTRLNSISIEDIHCVVLVEDPLNIEGKYTIRVSCDDALITAELLNENLVEIKME